MDADSLARPSRQEVDMSSIKNSSNGGDADWVVHDGGEMPVGPSTIVIVAYRCGAISEPIEAGQRRWKRWPSGDSEWDIVGWRLVGSK
jgi:hypothetical protein